MKSIVLASLLFSGVAMACPNLAGNYSCQVGPGVPGSDMSVTQKVVSGVTEYTTKDAQNTIVLRADGKEYSQSRPGTGGTTDIVKTTTSCKTDLVNVKFNYISQDASGQELSNIKVNAEVSLDANNNLKLVDSDESGSTTTICIRK